MRTKSEIDSLAKSLLAQMNSCPEDCVKKPLGLHCVKCDFSLARLNVLAWVAGKRDTPFFPEEYEAAL